MIKFFQITITYIFLTFAIFSIFISGLFSQTSEPDSTKVKSVKDTTVKSNIKADTSQNSYHPNKNLSLKLIKIDSTNIVIDGGLNEPEWKKAAKLENFTEIDPGDNTKPEVNTEAYMFYDEDNLYIGFICHEKNMKKLRKTLCARDNIFTDDFVGIIVDTYNEGKQSYELFANPYGIQADLLRNADGNEDASYDAIWFSDGKIYDDKWTVEMKIPFKSIRFPDKISQEWNLHILRIRPRESRYQYSWLEINRDNPTLFTESGKITNINNIKGGKNLEILPYFLTSQQGSISDFNNADSPFNNEDIKGEFGVNIKYGITSNLTADVTYNPDFSQVESDAGVIQVNSPYAVFYNEKRPFFIEGANIFESQVSAIYTRMINNPIFAVKLSGKIGKYDFGYLSGYDKRTPFIIPFNETSDFIPTELRSLSNIFRIKRTLYGESYLGLVFTDREVNNPGTKVFDIDGYNRNIGVDGSLRFLDNYSVQFMFLKSITQEVNYPGYYNEGTFDDGKYTRALDGENFSGFETYFNINRSARYWNFNISYHDAAPTIRRDLGYQQINDYRTISTYQGYTIYFKDGFIERMEPAVSASVRYNYDGHFIEVYAMPRLWFRLKNQISFSVSYLGVNNEEYKGVYLMHANRFDFQLNFSSFQMLRGGLNLNIGKFIVRQDNPFVGWGYDFNIWNDFKPIENFVLTTNLEYYELSESYKDEKLYAGYILRATGLYQISKPLSVRLIGELNTFSSTFYLNPLISYKPNPFTIFYAGFTTQYDQLVPVEGPAKYIMSGRQFFLKLQYLFRI